MLTTKTRDFKITDNTSNSSMPEIIILNIAGKGMLKIAKTLSVIGNRAAHDLTFRVYIDGNIITTENFIGNFAKLGLATNSSGSAGLNVSYNLPFEQEFKMTLEVKPNATSPIQTGYSVDVSMLFIMES